MATQTNNPFSTLKKGGLHKALGIKEGSKIPIERLQEALKSKSPHMRKMAQFAQNAKSFKNKKASAKKPIVKKQATKKVIAKKLKGKKAKAVKKLM